MTETYFHSMLGKTYMCIKLEHLLSVCNTLVDEMCVLTEVKVLIFSISFERPGVYLIKK